MTAASLNDLLERSEDPVRLIDDYLASQRDGIREAEKLHMQCISHSEAMKHQYLSALQAKEKREAQALIALKAGEDEIARLALLEKMQHEEKCGQYRELYEQSRQSLLELEGQLKELKDNYEEAASKRSFYQARMESLRLQQRMNERMGGFHSSVSPRIFSRMEERISGFELEARALNDVRRATQEAVYEAGNTLKQTLDKELARLKEKLDQERRSGL